MWTCLCKTCQKTVVVSTHELAVGKKNGRKHGCKDCFIKERRASRVGQRFGRLIVLERVQAKHEKRTWWKCQCDCGNFKNIPDRSLTDGSTASCGCFFLETKRKESGHNGMMRLFRTYQYGAEKRSLEFKLNEAEFKDITSRNCEYCGIRPLQTCKTPNSTVGLYIYNGIDRVDSNKGYFVDNCVSCCKICNSAKMAMPVEEFIAWIFRAADYLSKKQS